MTVLLTLLIVAQIFLLSACGITYGYRATPGVENDEPGNMEGMAWAAKRFTGGRQCEPHRPYEPPDVNLLFEDAGIYVYDTFVEPDGLYACCSCLAYSATHFVLIRAEDISDAVVLGFRKSEWPYGR